MRRPVVSTVVVPFVLPLRIAAWAAGALGIQSSATPLREFHLVEAPLSRQHRSRMAPNGTHSWRIDCHIQ